MLVVDVYNVLHTTGVLPPHLAGIEVDGLAALIATSRYGSRRAVLVCDGPRPRASRSAGYGEIVYAGPGREADDLIETVLRGHGRGVTVVSNDHRLQRAARRSRSKCLSCEVFLRQLAADHERAAAPGSRSRNSDRPAFATAFPLEPDLVGAWLRDFGISPADPILRLTGAAGQAAPNQLQGDATDSPPPAVLPARSERKTQHARDRQRGSRRPAAPTDANADPVIREALKEWAGRLSVDDLDMSKWLKD